MTCLTSVQSYIEELVDIAVVWNVKLHLYADDTQMSFHCKPDVLNSQTVSLEKCVYCIRHWMAANCLMLNADKTEFL